MSDKDTWGSWSINEDCTALVHEGGYGIGIAEIREEDRGEWWVSHLKGKGWATKQAIADFREAVADLLSSAKLDIADVLPNAAIAEAHAKRALDLFYARHRGNQAPPRAEHDQLVATYWHARQNRESIAERMLVALERRLGEAN